MTCDFILDFLDELSLLKWSLLLSHLSGQTIVSIGGYVGNASSHGFISRCHDVVSLASCGLRQ